MVRAIGRIVAATFAGALLLWGGHSVLALVSMPVAVVRIQGELTPEERQHVRDAVDEMLSARRSVDAGDIVDHVGRLAWVRNARARRIWPDTVHVEVERETLVARWGDTAFLTADGDIVETEVASPGSLPVLRAASSDSRAGMALLRTLSVSSGRNGLDVVQLAETPLGQWRATFANGVSVELGARDIVDRLRRFHVVYAEVLKGRESEVSRVDARYDSGIAIEWKAPVARVAMVRNP